MTKPSPGADPASSLAPHHAACSCGAVRLEAGRPPRARFFCHCTTCQKIYDAPFSDVTVTWSGAVRIVDGREHLRFERHHWLPASIRRGFCSKCGQPIVGDMQIPVPGVRFVPTARWSNADALPPPLGHLNYHSRVREVDDDLPKIEGVWRSELVASGWLLPRLLKPRPTR